MATATRTVLCECGCGLLAPISDQTDSARGWIKGEPRRFRQGHHMRSQEHKVRLTGENNHKWQGDDVDIGALHLWVKRQKVKTGICSHCEMEAATQWANVSGEYHRDPDDFIELCQSCHARFDAKRRVI